MNLDYPMINIAYAETTTEQNITPRKCYKCPHGIKPGQNCLNDPNDLGIEEECRGDEGGLINGCETIIVGMIYSLISN